MELLTLGFSPCPNDTFIFHGMVNGLIDSNYKYDYFLHDVEKLNELAFESTYDVTKLSFAALGKLNEKYGLLRSGAALGKGCGPLLVKRKGLKNKNLKDSKIAIPGIMTTANLLLNLYAGSEIDTVSMRFDKIFSSIEEGITDYGVIIHEGRFTYMDHNLEIVEDLGSWWEKKTNLPIPLGGIAVKRDMKPETAKAVEQSIEKSIKLAYSDRKLSESFIKENAQELENSVIENHINLYVNEFSINISETGYSAISTMFDMAVSTGFFPKLKNEILAF